MTLDVLSPKGQQSVRDEALAVELFTGKYPSFTYIDTPKDRPATVDAVLMDGGRLAGVVETKCRNATVEQFFGEYGGQWLVTFEKIVAGRELALSMGVSLIGFLYLIPSKTLLVQRLTTDDGLYIPEMCIKTTKTQRTVNGGQILRTNAYIDMTQAKRIA